MVLKFSQKKIQTYIELVLYDVFLKLQNTTFWLNIKNIKERYHRASLRVITFVCDGCDKVIKNQDRLDYDVNAYRCNPVSYGDYYISYRNLLVWCSPEEAGL